MKNNILSTSIAVALALSLTACGGGGGSETTSPPTTTTPPVVTDPPTDDTTEVATADLEVSQDFDFRTDMDVTLVITSQPSHQGVVNVYHAYEHHDEANNIYYPDYQTRVLSFYPSATDSVEIQVSKNWEHLVVEFVPTTAEGTEMYKKLELTNSDYLSFSFND